MININKLLLFSLLTLCVLFGLIACTQNFDGELLKARETSMQLGMQLKEKLLMAMQSGGPEKALSVCNVEAQGISNGLSDDNMLNVGRTSLKIRNPNNQPDSWEEEQLKGFESQKLNGADPRNLETYEVVTEGNKSVFRYMKAIPMQPPCMLCHGSNLAPDIQSKITQLYPEDKATNFAVDDIRGAFTVKIILEN